MTIKYTLPKNNSELTSLINIAVSSASTMKIKVQVAAVAILYHAFKHGDYSKANNLIEDLGQGIKRDSLIKFFIDFGGLIIDTDNSKGFTGWQGKDFIESNFEKAKSTMWYELKKDNPFQGYDLNEQLRKLINTASKNKEKVDKMEDSEIKDKYNFKINDEVVKSLLTLANLDVIEPTVEEQIAEELAKAS